MRIQIGLMKRFRCVLAASVIALLGIAPALASEAAGPATPSFVPTLTDYLSIYDALQRYRMGAEKHDQKLLDSAFWKPQKPPTPPPGLGPPPGSALDSAGFINVWHMPLDSYIKFRSATRATHYEYFLAIYPLPEKKGEGLSNMEARTSIVGWPGHYDDILEKRHGEWRILERTTINGEK